MFQFLFENWSKWPHILKNTARIEIIITVSVENWTNPGAKVFVLLRTNSCIYLLLTEFEVPTVSYGPSFFPVRFMAQARSARTINRRGKNEKTRLVRYLLYIYCVTDGIGNDFYPWGMASNFWSRSEAKGVTLKSFFFFFKSLARFSTQFRVKERFKPLLAK